MDWWQDLFSHENITHWLETYKGWGWWLGIALPFVESLLPILPLAAIVVANAAAFGIWKGFLLSEIGALLGSVLVYLLARKFGDRFGNWIKKKFPKTKKMFKKLENKGFWPVFLLSTLPHTPSVLLNIAAGITQMPFLKFVAAVALGQGVMIAVFSYVGQNFQEWLDRPWVMALIAVGLVALWFIGRKMNKDEQSSN